MKNSTIIWSVSETNVFCWWVRWKWHSQLNLSFPNKIRLMLLRIVPTYTCVCIRRLIYFIFSGETWRLPFLMLVCSFARSFTYYIFAVVYFGYDKSLLYLNSSICKVINFSLSLARSFRRTSNQLKWTRRYTCHKSIYYLIVYCECLLSLFLLFSVSRLKWALFRVCLRKTMDALVYIAMAIVQYRQQKSSHFHAIWRLLW